MKLDKYKLIISGLVGITACSGLVVAYSYADTPASSSSSANASITVANTINLTLTGGDLVIDNLTPGNASDSNIITATITSNSPYGYHLSATTGTSTGTTSLVNTADSNFSFTNLSANKASLNDFSDNTWGYSYSTDNGTTWISGDYGTALSGYNGLTLDNDDSGATGTTLFNNDSYAGSTAVKFKIGVKSATTQAAGTYTGTVNFYAVTNPEPLPYMQDMTSTKLNQLLPNVGDITTLYDNRDEQAYQIAKLADNKYWMVENLSLAGGTSLSADNTDVTSAYISSFTTSNNLTKNGNTIVLPGSSTSGFNTNNYSYVYNSGNKTNCGVSGQNTPCYSYYSWDAATLGSGRTIATENTDAPYSVCPKGWKLPTSGNSSNNEWKRGDFYKLATAYGANLESYHYDNSSATGSNFYNNAGPGTIPGFLLAGLYNSGFFSSGGGGAFYWSSTSRSNTSGACYSDFNSSGVDSANSYGRNAGFSVRCLFSGQ